MRTAGSKPARLRIKNGSERVPEKTVLYASAGPHLDLYDIDFGEAALHKRASVTLPANVQYAWLHPSRRTFYVVSSNGGPGLAGDRHWASAYRVDPATGELSAARRAGGAAVAPAARLGRSQRPVSADRLQQSERRHGAPPGGDGAIGAAVDQPAKLDTGIYAHQVLTTPGNRTAILVARGNHAAGGKAEDPGALKLYDFDDGVLTDRASIAPDGGYGFGPRHIDFHPTRPWVFVSIERQNRLAVYALNARRHARPRSAVRQGHAARTRARQARRSRPDRSMSIRTAASST